MNCNNTGDQDDGDSIRKFTFLEVVYVLKEKAWLILVCCIAGLFVGLGYSANHSKIFRANAVIEVVSDEPNMLRFEGGQPPDYTNQDAMQTIVASFRSRTLLQNVLKKHGLLADRRFAATNAGMTEEEAIQCLMRATQVEVRKGTRLIDITSEFSNAETAQKLANALASEFISMLIEQRASTSRIAVKFLMDEAATLKTKLQHSEEALQEYRENHNSVSLEERQDTVVSKMKDQNAKLTEAKAARLRLEADCKNVMEHSEDVKALLTLACVSDHPTVKDCKQLITNLESKIAVLSLRYTELHPKMIQAKAQKADAEKLLNTTVLKIPSLLQSTCEAAITTEKNFEGALQEQEKLALVLNRQAIPYNVLYRDMETDRALYEAILKRLKEADIAKGVEQTNIRIFESATLPSGPVNPSKAKVAALGVMAGMLLGIAVSFGLHLLDNSLKTVDQAERATGLMVIGAIPRAAKSVSDKNSIYLLNDPKSVIAEAFRSFRASLHMVTRRKDGGVFLFTSAMAAEGKTFTSIHLGVALAQQGLKTLIIDADLRAPRVGDIFACDRHSMGLSDMLSNPSAEFSNYQATQIRNLHFLPAGTRIVNPAELLAGDGFGKLIKQASREFDALVIDTAPIHAVSDTLLFVEHADWVCLVTKSGATPAKALIRARQQLEMAGARIAGLVLNQLPRDGGVGYYYYYSPGRYGSYGYGVKQEVEESIS